MFSDKVKLVGCFMIFFGFIVTTNLVDRKSVNRIKDSVVTIYKDRLIATDVILDLLKLVQVKELTICKSDSVLWEAQQVSFNEQVNHGLSRFAQTTQTPDEHILFLRLKKNIEDLKRAEEVFLFSNYQNKGDVLMYVAKIKENLYALSGIQMEEGKKQMFVSKKALNTIELFTQIEIWILIFLGLLVSTVIAFGPKGSK